MEHLLNAYIGNTIVVETDSRLTYIGLLQEIGDQHLKLSDVAVYDPKTLRVSQEEFLIEAINQGAPAARREILIRQAQVVSIGRLSDVIDPLKITENAH